MTRSVVSKVLVGDATAYDGRGKRDESMKGKFLLVAAFAMVAALAFAGVAGAAVTVPAVPVSDYGSALLSSLATAIGQILPYAAAVTAFAIGVGMLKRWLGHRKATRI